MHEDLFKHLKEGRVHILQVDKQMFVYKLLSKDSVICKIKFQFHNLLVH